MKKILLFSLLFTLIATNLMAEEQKDTAFANLYRRYFQLYTEGNESIFYDASAKMKDYYLRNNKYDSYYISMTCEATIAWPRNTSKMR